MDWFKDILKDLAISKTLVAAIFATAVVMNFGPILAPAHVPPLPKEFVAYNFGSMVLTGFLLALWWVEGLWSAAKVGIQKVAAALADQTLVDVEQGILILLGQNPTEPINLREIDYARAPGTKLEFHQWAKGLERKGLVQINPYDDNLISLTEKGRERALETHRRRNPAGAA